MANENDLTYNIGNTSPTNIDPDKPRKPQSNQLTYTPKDKAIHRTTGAGMAVHGYDLNIGDSKYDKGLRWGTDIDEADVKGSINEYRAEKQGFTETALAGVARAAVKGMAEAAKTPGVILGTIGGIAGNIEDAITGVDDTNFVKTAFNNSWIKGIDNLNKTAQDEFMPVYVHQAIQDGDLFDKMFSSEFWATDGADGLGYAVGMMLPGAALGKLGLGAKLIGAGNKLEKAAEIFAAADRAEDFVNAASKIGATARRIDSGIAITYNTMAEAGAEAKEFGDRMREPENKSKTIDSWKKTGYTKTPEYEKDVLKYYEDLDNQRRAGRITLEQQNQLMSNPQAVQDAVLEKRFEDQVAKGELGVFGMNAMILLGPNALMHQRLFGRVGRSAEKIAEKGATKAATGRIGKALATPTAKYIGEKGAKYGRVLAENVAAEGFWEEGMQTTVSNLYEKYAKDNSIDYAMNFNVGDLAKEYADMIGSTEGQVAVMLGGVLGTGMSGISTHMQTKQENKIKNAILNKVDVSLNNFNTIFNAHDIYERDENGKIVMEEDSKGNTLNKPKVNKEKAANVVKALAVNDFEQILYNHAIDQGNHDFIRAKQEEALFQMVLPAVYNGEKGLQLLKQQMDANKDFQDIVARDQDPSTKFKFKDVVDKAMKTAEHLQKENDKFNDFSDAMINLADDRLDGSKASKDIRADYMNELNSRYLQAKFNIFNNEERLKTLEKQRDNVMQELNIHMTPEQMLSNAQLVNNTMGTNPLFKQTIEDIQKVSQQIAKDKKDIAEVWDGKATKQSFKEFVDSKLKEQQEAEDEDKLQDVVNGVQSAKTPEELETILNKDLDEDFPEKDKVFEYQNIKRLISSVNEDDSIENVSKALDALKNTKYNSYNTQKLIKYLENRILLVQKEQNELKNELNSIIDDYSAAAQVAIDSLKDTNKSIDELIKVQKSKSEELAKVPEKIRGRNSKIIKENVKQLNKELSETEKKIDELIKRRTKLEDYLKQIDSRLDPLLTAIEGIEKHDFRSINDVVNFLKANQEEFGSHRFDITRLSLHKFYTEQNIEGLNKAIVGLEDYKDVLQRTIRNLLDADENHSEDLYYLQEQLNDAIEDLENKRKELATESVKLERLKEATLNKDLSNILAEEIDLFEKLADVRKSKPRTAFNNIMIDKIISEKKDTIKKEDNEVANEEEAISEELTAEQEFQMQFLEENYTVGDEFVLGIQFGTAKSLNGKTATVTKIEPGKKVFFKTEDGKRGSVNIDKFYKAVFNPELNFGTEGGQVETVEATQRYDKEKPYFTTNGAKIISVDDSGQPLPFVSPEFINFERSPTKVKIGQEVGFEINTEAIQNDKWRLALSAYNAGDFSDMDLLINHLPINIVFKSGEKAPMETYYETKEKGSEQFDKTSKVLRNAIINELKSGKDIKTLSTTVEGQYNGELQVEETVVENKVQDLFQFGGDIKNIKADNIYVVNDLGALVNHKGNIFPTNRELAPGEVYIQINTAAGFKFPLKLNVKRINKQQADVLYDLYQYRFEDLKDRTKAQTLKEVRLENPELVAKIEKELEKELKVIGKKVDDVTVKDLIDFMIWDGTNSIKSRMKFINTRDKVTKLAIFDKEYTQEQFANFPRQTFINRVTSAQRNELGKRQHIRFKPTKDSGIKGISLANNTYLKYLLEEGILNTNAKVGMDNHTFQGQTNMYLKNNELKVGDELSAFNPKTVIEIDNKKIMIDPVKFEEAHPELYERDIDLNDDGSLYVDAETGDEFNRVSELKKTPEDTDNDINVDSTVRGDVIDELMRKHLGDMITMDVEQFKDYGREVLKKANKKKGTNVTFSDLAYEQTYQILEDYKRYFQKEGIMIITSIPTLAGQIGKKAYAGTVDIMGYDTKSKEYIIIDLKTSTTSRAEAYENPETDKWDYIGKDAIQQNAYAELFEQMTGKPIGKIYIMPLIVPKESKTSYNVNEVLKDSSELLTISMEKNIYQLKKIQKVVTPKIVPASKQNLSDALLADWQKAMKAGAKPDMTMKLNGIQYGYIDSVGVMAYQDKNKNLLMVEDKALAIKVIESGNAKISNKMAGARVNIDKFEKNWNSRVNSLSLQEAKPTQPKIVPTKKTEPKIVPAKKATPTTKEVNESLKDAKIPVDESLLPKNKNMLSEMESYFSPTTTTQVDEAISASEEQKAFLAMMMGTAPSVTATTQETKEEVKEVIREVVEEQQGINFKKLSQDGIKQALRVLEDLETENDYLETGKILEKHPDNSAQLLEAMYNYHVGKSNAETITNKLKGCK